MKNGVLTDAIIEALLQPETKLERKVLQNPSFRKGLLWGQPRFGHPEGKIIYHIREVMDNIEKVCLNGIHRNQLRLITFAHDTFKYLEDKSGNPRDWNKHHAVYARKFMEQYTDDKTILDITELHDEAYYCWRQAHLFQKSPASEARLQNLLDRLQNNLQLFYIFFKCDTRTGDKNQAPLKWFEKSIEGIDIVQF